MCKICPKCKTEKELNSFGKDKNQKDGLTRMCKLCKNRTNGRTPEQNKVRYDTNREKEKLRNLKRQKERKVYNRNLYLKQRKERLLRQNDYYEINRDKIVKKRRIENLTPEERELRNSKIKKRIHADPILKLKYRVRSRIYLIFRAKGIKKKLKSLDYIGCSVEFLKGYIEAQFKEGMNWGNNTRFGWHVDHIIPLASANTEEEVKALCHYSNLQPLWHYENSRKCATMPENYLKIAI